MTQIIAIANPKGGVGKTSTAINLGASLAIGNKKVILIDTDPTSALTMSLGVDPADKMPGIFEVFLGTFHAVDLQYPYHLRNLALVPANIATPDRESRLSSMAAHRAGLKRRLEKLVNHEKLYADYILIDTPPVMNDLTRSVLYAAHFVLIPLQCGYFAINAAQRLLEEIKRIKEISNPSLRIAGILLNFFEKNTLASQLTLEESNRLFGTHLLKTIIPKNTTISFATFKKKPVALIDVNATGSLAYFSLATELQIRTRTK
jgi:chromosome partitioning protein